MILDTPTSVTTIEEFAELFCAAQKEHSEPVDMWFQGTLWIGHFDDTPAAIVAKYHEQQETPAQPAPKFKVGDRVRRNGNPGPQAPFAVLFEPGEIVTVQYVDVENGWYGFFGRSTTIETGNSQFDLVEEAESAG